MLVAFSCLTSTLLMLIRRSSSLPLQKFSNISMRDSPVGDIVCKGSVTVSSSSHLSVSLALRWRTLLSTTVHSIFSRSLVSWAGSLALMLKLWYLLLRLCSSNWRALPSLTMNCSTAVPPMLSHQLKSTRVCLQASGARRLMCALMNLKWALVKAKVMETTSMMAWGPGVQSETPVISCFTIFGVSLRELNLDQPGMSTSRTVHWPTWLCLASPFLSVGRPVWCLLPRLWQEPASQKKPDLC